MAYFTMKNSYEFGTVLKLLSNVSKCLQADTRISTPFLNMSHLNVIKISQNCKLRIIVKVVRAQCRFEN